MRSFIHRAFCLLLLLGLSWGARAQAGFVRVQGHQFVLDGQPYRYVGANYWYGGVLATQGKAGEKRLKKELDFLRKQGVTNLRVMVGAEGIMTSAYPYRVAESLQPRQGQFDDTLLRGLDYLLRELDRRQMKAVLHFTNTWEWSGGLSEYLAWNGYGRGSLPKDPDYSWDKYRAYIAQFYDCQPCQTALDAYIRHVLARTNSLTGRKYVDEPAIMAWEIINEPRPMEPAATPAFLAWMSRTAALIKSLDSQHLLTTGSEGKIATDNNLDTWRQLHADPHIDYTTIHMWPKNWGWFQDTAIARDFRQVISRTTAYVREHEAAALALNKPLVIEEFGLPRNQQSFAIDSSPSLRDAYYDAIFGLVEQSARSGGPLVGCNFWAFGGTARPIPGQPFWKPGDAYLGDPGGEEQGLNSVFTSDKSTWKEVKETSFQLRIKN